MQVAAGYVLHVGSMSRGTLKAGDLVSAEVDYVRRQRIVPNHTFTHVLNFALREARTSNPLSSQQSSSVADLCQDDAPVSRIAEIVISPCCAG